MHIKIDDALKNGAATRPMSVEEEHAYIHRLHLAATPSEAWSEPTLDAESPLPSWPEGVGPAVYERFTTELAEEVQTSPDVPKMHGLAVSAAPLQGRYQARVRDGWMEPLSLYIQIGSASGERKTAIDSATARPLADFEAEAHEYGMEAVKANQRERALRESLAEAAKKKASKLGGEPDARAVFQELAKEADELPTLRPRRLLADDITPESLGDLMMAQGGPIAVLSAEAGFVESMCGKYSAGRSLSVLPLKAYSGERHPVDRIGRVGGAIERPALTLS